MQKSHYKSLKIVIMYDCIQLSEKPVMCAFCRGYGPRLAGVFRLFLARKKSYPKKGMRHWLVVLVIILQTGAVSAADLSSEDLAGVVLMPSFEKNVKVEVFAKMLCDIHARSYIILRSDTSKQLVDNVQKSYEKQCEKARAKRERRDVIRLVAALDAEPSLMKFRMPSVRVSDTNQLFTDTEIVDTAQVISKALLEAGIRINFAPIYDTGENTTVIGNRTFRSFIPQGFRYVGSSGGTSEAVRKEIVIMQPAEAVRKANVFMKATVDAGVIPTAKHFPGHGHAMGDTHKTLETIPATLPELPNFVSSIQAGVPMIMVGHLVTKDTRTLKERTAEKREVWESDGLPATLSKKIMTDLLRKRLGFKGVIITDSMAMGALKGQADRSVRSLEAGADIILIPPDPRSAYARIVQKMTQDKVFEKALQAKAERIVALYK